MAENTDPDTYYSYLHAGHPRQVPNGKLTGAADSDLISFETKMGTWETVGTSTVGMQSTFEVRAEPRGDHIGNEERMRLQGQLGVCLAFRELKPDFQPVVQKQLSEQNAQGSDRCSHPVLSDRCPAQAS